jgi:hypothetical protein
MMRVRVFVDRPTEEPRPRDGPPNHLGDAASLSLRCSFVPEVHLTSTFPGGRAGHVELKEPEHLESSVRGHGNWV